MLAEDTLSTSGSPRCAVRDPAVLAIDHELLRSIESQLVVDTSERHAVSLLVGRNGAHIRLAPGAIQLLREVARGVSFERIADLLSRRDGKPVAASEVESA